MDVFAYFSSSVIESGSYNENICAGSQIGMVVVRPFSCVLTAKDAVLHRIGIASDIESNLRLIIQSGGIFLETSGCVS